MANKSQLTACKSPEVVIVGGSDKCTSACLILSLCHSLSCGTFDVAQPIKPDGLHGGDFWYGNSMAFMVMHQ